MSHDHPMQTNRSESGCALCGSRSLETLIDFGHMPIAHRFLDTPEAAEETFPLTIFYCTDCGFGQINEPIDPEILYREYNHCFTSWKPEPHRAHQLERLGRAMGQKQGVFEIGCNDGLFMEMLRDRGVDHLIGLEPNRVAASQARERGFTVYEDFLTADLGKKVREEHGPFGAVVSRQVLEHVIDVSLFSVFPGKSSKRTVFFSSMFPTSNRSCDLEIRHSPGRSM